MRTLTRAMILITALSLAASACSPPSTKTAGQGSSAASPADGKKDKVSKEERRAEKLKKKAAKQALKASKRL